jgi:hypothetical protein
MVFKVINDADKHEARFNDALGAISLAITHSMASKSEARVLVDEKLVCIARGGRLIAPDGRREITPAEAVRTAETLVGVG